MATAVYSDNHQETLNEYPSALYTGTGLRYMYDTYTALTAGGSTGGARTIDFPRLLPGKVIVFPQLCHIDSTDQEAGADLHIGHRAYVNSSRVTVAEDDDEWAADVDSGGGALNGFWADLTGATLVAPAVYDAQDGLRIFVTIDTGDISIGDTVTLVVVYAHVQ